jgi:DNA-binding HxlR family transcriptional regulator
MDTQDLRDAPDAPNPRDTSDAPDLRDTPESPDLRDTPNPRDTSDTPDLRDAANAPDRRGARDLGQRAEIHMTGPLSPRSSWPAPRDICPIERALDAVGTKSAFVLLREAFYGATRFEEFVSRTDLSEPAVASRLRELTAHGLLERVPYQEPGQRVRSGYRLTQKGSELLPALVALMDWGDRWTTVPRGTRIEVAHSGCGSPVHAALRCEAGHDVAPDALDLRSKRA